MAQLVRLTAVAAGAHACMSYCADIVPYDPQGYVVVDADRCACEGVLFDCDGGDVCVGEGTTYCEPPEPYVAWLQSECRNCSIEIDDDGAQEVSCATY